MMIVEVDGLLDQPESEQIDAEIEVWLRRVYGRRYVMQARECGESSRDSTAPCRGRIETAC